MSKACTKCGKAKTFDQFYLNHKKTNYASRCKLCVAAAAKKYRKTDRGRQKRRQRHALASESKPGQTQVCRLCNKDKELTEFYKDKRKKYGRDSKCKVCDKIYRKQFLTRKYAYNKKWKKMHPEYMKKYRIQNPKYALRPRVKQTKEEKRRRVNLQRKIRYKNDPVFRIKCSLRARLAQALKGLEKSESTMKLLGCTGEYAKNYIESQFEEGMTWSNHGNGPGNWNIDHIRPISSFDLTKLDEQRACSHYTNLQPLWWEDNSAKSNKPWEEYKIMKQIK